MFGVITQKMRGLWFGFVLSIILLLYGLSSLPGHILAAFLMGLPVFIVWRRRMIGLFIEQKNIFESQVTRLETERRKLEEEKIQWQASQPKPGQVKVDEPVANKQNNVSQVQPDQGHQVTKLLIKVDVSSLPIQESNIPGWFSLKELSLLYEAIMYAKPDECVEIGSYVGRSTHGICSALRDLGGPRKLLCIDMFNAPTSKDTSAPAVRKLIERFPTMIDEYFDNEKYPTALDSFKLTLDKHPFMKPFVEIKVCNSKHLELVDEAFGFALIDGDHTYEGVKNDLIKLLPSMKKGAVVVFHDNSNHFPGVQMFISEVKKLNEFVYLGQADTAIAFQINDEINNPTFLFDQLSFNEQPRP
jgi:predicted O-methyltransferase YrrM